MKALERAAGRLAGGKMVTKQVVNGGKKRGAGKALKKKISARLSPAYV